MPGKKTNKPLTVVEDGQAQLLETVTTLRTAMSVHDNVGYALQKPIDFLADDKIRKEAHELATKTANKIAELLQEVEGTKLYKDMAMREKRRRKLHGTEDTKRTKK